MAKKQSATNTTQAPTTTARKRRTRPGPGHDMLCHVLKGVYDWNKEIASNPKNSERDRAQARDGANRAREDGERWGCTWAERM
jgi:hypothetical protein